MILKSRRNNRCVFKNGKGLSSRLLLNAVASKRTDKILLAWRVKLEKEPTLLQPFQIDEIIREVRQRLSKISR